MRLKMLFELQRPVLIPWDYRTSLTRMIYETLMYSDEEYAQWLHDEGFRRDNKVYRLFVYSDLKLWYFTLEDKGLRASRWITWQVASPDPRFIEKFLDGLKKRGNELTLFQNSFKLIDVLYVNLPSSFEGLTFHTISPIVVSTFNLKISRHPIYLNPDQPEFAEAVEKNLIAKWEAFHKSKWGDKKFGIRAWDPKKKLINVFGINVRAWNLKVQIWGPEELIRFAYDTGLGERNSQGFGMIEVGGKNDRDSYSSDKRIP